jgi:DNA (cytosine-5)-methyltransferase 1
MLTIGSLFSGIGGLELGLERAGLGPVIWQAESDPYARKVLAKHWPGVPIYEDVRDIDERAPRPDLICGGFPCQPVSLVGHRRADADERWLWPEFQRILARLRPRLAIIENVPGLLSRGMDAVLGGLAESGFDAEWSDLPACFVGTPHPRERLFIVAHTDQAGQPDDSWWPGSEAFARQWQLAVSRDWDDVRVAEWPPEPALDRVVDGLPDAMDQLAGLGNAVVPQVSEWIGRRIVESLQMERA